MDKKENNPSSSVPTDNAHLTFESEKYLEALEQKFVTDDFFSYVEMPDFPADVPDQNAGKFIVHVVLCAARDAGHTFNSMLRLLRLELNCFPSYQSVVAVLDGAIAR